MKDNKQFIANSPYEGNGTSYFQMMNDNSISKEDRILNKDIIYLKAKDVNLVPKVNTTFKKLKYINIQRYTSYHSLLK